MKKIDYTTITPTAAPNEEKNFNKRWWMLEEPLDRAQCIVKIVNYLAENDSKRQSQYQTNARLYGNITLMGVNGISYAKSQVSQGSIKDRVTFNLVGAVVDTITSKMAKNKPRSSFLTEGGNWRLQRKAKKLDKFCDGVRYENKGYSMGVDAFRDASIFGDGLIHVFPFHGRVKWERTLASELFVDTIDAFYGKPRVLYRVWNIDRDVLHEMFPEKKDLIEKAPAAKADLTGMYQNVSDQVTVVEAWHLPSGPEATDGLKCMVVENGELDKVKWKKPYFPFAKLPWKKRLYGHWGQGIPEELQSIQLEANKIAWVIQRSMHLAGTFKVWLKNGSKMPKEQVNNDIGAIWNSDEKPEYILPPIVQPEVYQRLMQLKEDAFEQIGISQLSSMSKKPEGLDSGKALREFNDIESDRFMTIGQAYEQFFLELDRLSIDCAKEIAATSKGFEVKVPGRKFLETIKWSDVDLEDDEYLMKAYPVSSLPQDPSGRMQTIQEYVQAGWYSPREGKRLMDMPDLEQIDTLQDANENWIHEKLEAIVEDGNYSPPEPEMDLELAKQLVLQYIAQGATTDVSEERMSQLRLFNTQIDALRMKAMPPAPMAPPPQAGGPADGMSAPQAQPEPTPMSPMIPNTAGAA